MQPPPAASCPSHREYKTENGKTIAGTRTVSDHLTRSVACYVNVNEMVSALRMGMGCMTHDMHSWLRIMKYSAQSGAYAAGTIPRKYINHLIISSCSLTMSRSHCGGVTCTRGLLLPRVLTRNCCFSKSISLKVTWAEASEGGANLCNKLEQFHATNENGKPPGKHWMLLCYSFAGRDMYLCNNNEWYALIILSKDNPPPTASDQF